MAGGSDWFFEDKEDGADTRQLVEDDAPTRHFRAQKVTFTIWKQIKADSIDLGQGDYGRTSGMLTCMVGRRLKTRSFGGGKLLLCVSDRTSKEQGPGKYAIRRQVWELIFPEEEYDSTTGAVIP